MKTPPSWFELSIQWSEIHRATPGLQRPLITLQKWYSTLTNIILLVAVLYMHMNYVSVEISINWLLLWTCALDSSVGRAEDCSWLMAEILRSLVRLRFEGFALFLSLWFSKKASVIVVFNMNCYFLWKVSLQYNLATWTIFQLGIIVAVHGCIRVRLLNTLNTFGWG